MSKHKLAACDKCGAQCRDEVMERGDRLCRACALREVDRLTELCVELAEDLKFWHEGACSDCCNEDGSVKEEPNECNTAELLKEVLVDEVEDAGEVTEESEEEEEQVLATTTLVVEDTKEGWFKLSLRSDVGFTEDPDKATLGQKIGMTALKHIVDVFVDESPDVEVDERPVEN